MKNIKSKLSLISVICLLTISCSDDTNTEIKTENQSGKISNEVVTLTYGSSLLSSNIELRNSKISFDRLVEDQSIVTKVSSASGDYKMPDLTNATKLTGNNRVSIDDDKLYYIPQGETLSGGINFNGKATLVVLGTLGGTNQINIPNGGKVEIAPSGSIARTVNFHLNSGSTLNNYGSVFYTSGSVDGKINNYNGFIFVNSVNLNGSSEISNNCGLTFEAGATVNAIVTNNGFINFKGGFHINGSGNLILEAGSLTDITGGKISIDGKIKNEGTNIARVDISNVTIENMNASPAFVGKIDININSNTQNTAILTSRINNEVTLNGNTYIAAKDCTPGRGIPTCDGSKLQFTLAATISSPSTNNIDLSATDVRINNGLAYVSYHTNDEIYGDSPIGALRIFNIQDQRVPSLISEAIFNNVEFNGVDINNNQLYAVGDNKDGARLVHTPLVSGAFNTSDLSVFKTYKIPGADAKNSFIYNDMLWLVSGGTNGGFFKVNPSSNYEVSERLYTDGARSKYTIQNKTVRVFFAIEEDGAYLQISNNDGTNVRKYRYNTLVQNVKTGKNTMDIDESYLYIALSDRGVAKIELATGKLVAEFQPNTYRIKTKNSETPEGSKVFKENGLTNSVAITDCFVFLANGADGIIVLEKDNFNVVGSFKLSESANFVYVKDGLLFVATGRNGLNIIKMN